ncbi:MAG TPA: hypothetical protein VM008_12275 [Phycisphaerae bacterium]|nr:hypothetical protein [Phycisphaerae bacterium]
MLFHIRNRPLVSILASSVAISCALIPAFAGNKPKAPTNPPPQQPAPKPTNTLTTTLQADQKDISAASAALAMANKDLNDALEQVPSVIAAKKAVADATLELQTAEDADKATLADNAAYKAAEANESKLRVELDDLRNSGATQDQISAKATEVFNAGSVTSKIERDAETADPKFVAAQKKLADANTALTAARTSAKNDPSVAALKQAHDDAQAKLTAAIAKLNSDRKGGTAPTPTASGR